MLRPLLAVVVLLALVGCSPQPGMIEVPEEVTAALAVAKAEAESRDSEAQVPRAIALCYGSQVNTPEDVFGYAEFRCERYGEAALHYGEDEAYYRCPLLQPVRATFLCYDPDLPVILPQP
jgi:hypothetical protein